MNLPYPCPECGHSHDVEFTPPRPAPPCSNPNSPAFSDDGDGLELDLYPEHCEACGMLFDDCEIVEHLLSNL